MEQLIKRYPALKCCEEDINKAIEFIIDTYKNKGKILVCGNGGSAADCEHMVGELMKGFRLKREVEDLSIPEDIRKCLQGALPAISLPSQTALISAYNNDVNADNVYAQLVYGYANKEDLVIGFTTSGNSINVVNAVKVANAIGVKSIVLTGAEGGVIEQSATVTIKVPETETYKVQEYHLPVYHYLCMKVEEYFFKKQD